MSTNSSSCRGCAWCSSTSRWSACWTAGFRGLAKTREQWSAPVGDRRTKDRLTDGQRAFNRLQAGLRALVEQAIAHLANAWALRRWRGLLYRVRMSTGPPAS